MGPTTKRQKYNIGLLKEPTTREDSKLFLINKYQVLQELLDEETDLETHWQKVRERDAYINLSGSNGPQDAQTEGINIGRHIAQDT